MLQQFIRDNQDADVATLALQRKRYPNLSDSDFRFALQQIDGRQRSKDKHPSFVSTPGWLFPPKLNIEQSSSELTARYKASLIAPLGIHTLIDATGGYGVDTFYLSAHAHETHYFEQNTSLADIAAHNFRLTGRDSIICHPEPFTPTQLSICQSSIAQSSILDRLVLETDAPYMAPVPHRGERNESRLMIHVAERLAQVCNCSVEEIITATTANAQRLFCLK